MKNIFKYAMTMALPMLALASCTDKYEYDGTGAWDANAGYQQIYFEESSATVELDPTDPTTTSFNVFRRDASSAATLKLEVIKNTDDVFTVGDAVFAAGDTVATVNVSFPNAEIGTTYTLQVTTTDPSNVSNYSKDILYTMNLTRVKWNLLGTGNFAENFWYGGDWDVEIYQRDDKKNVYRIPDPFGVVCQYYIDHGSTAIDGTQSENVVLTVLQPGDILDIGGGKEHEVENSDLVDFTDMSSGYHHSSYDATVMLYHPRQFTKAADDEDAWAWNKVLSYQEDGKTPGQIQLAPRYYMDGVGGWDQSQADGQLIITFPGYTPPYNAKIDKDFEYTEVFEGLFTSNKLGYSDEGIGLYVGAKPEDYPESYGDAYERFAEEYGTPYAVVSPYASGYNLYFAVNEDGKIVIPDGYERQPIGLDAVGEDVYAQINGGASTFTNSEVTLDITFTNKKGDIEYGTTKEIIANITWTAVGTGAYTYDFYAWYYFSDNDGNYDPFVDSGYTISQRDDDESVYKIENWNNGGNLIFKWDKKTNDCVVYEAETGIVDSSVGMIYASDVAEYTGNPAYYNNYPCAYDPETKTFNFSLIYYYDGKNVGIWEEAFEVDWNASSAASRHLVAKKTSKSLKNLKSSKKVNGLAKQSKTSRFGKGTKVNLKSKNFVADAQVVK